MLALSRIRPVIGWSRRGLNGVAALQSALLLALVPCLLLGFHNTGRQANLAIAAAGDAGVVEWRRSLIAALGSGYDPNGIGACVVHGFLIFLPLGLTALITAELWRRAFGRGGTAEALGSAATALILVLALPPATPAWEVAIGASFGIVIGKEIFGGTGMNFLHPAIVGLAFLYFAYPDSMRGADVWTATGTSATPPMAIAAAGGTEGLGAAGVRWFDAFLGNVPGPIGATSTVASLLGAVVLLLVRWLSWRLLGGALLGVIAIAAVFRIATPADMPAATLPWYWHVNIGGFAYALVFLAGDPVTAASTNPGRWAFGAFIGAMTVLVRVANPAQTEGVLLAVLLGSIVAPLIDHGFVRVNMRRRKRRCG